MDSLLISVYELEHARRIDGSDEKERKRERERGREREGERERERESLTRMRRELTLSYRAWWDLCSLDGSFSVARARSCAMMRALIADLW